MLDAIVLAGVGALVAALGLATWAGRTELLAQSPTGDGSDALAARAGSTLVVYGLCTLGTAGLVATTALSTGPWVAWTVLTVVVGFGVAGLAAADR